MFVASSNSNAMNLSKITLLILAIFIIKASKGQDIYTAISDGNLQQVQQLLSENPELLNAQNRSGQTPLWKAAEKGNLGMVQFLLKQGADPAIGDNEHTLPFHMAAVTGNIELFDVFHNKGFDINILDDNHITPLFYAIQGRHPEMVKHILDLKGSVKIRSANGFTPMLYAAIFGPAETMQLLLDHKGNVNVQTNSGVAPLHSACSFGRTDIVKMLVEHGADIEIRTEQGDTPLMWARNPNSYESAKYLIEKGADVNARNNRDHTPLMSVVERGAIPNAQLLLDHGADINAINTWGGTPLTMAAFARDSDAMCKFLILRGAAVNPGKPQIETPLHRAVAEGNMGMIKNLVENGAHINRADEDGYTPLHMAIKYNQPKAAAYLLEHGSFVNIPDNTLGNCELHLAAMRGSEEMMEQLIEAGADVNARNHEGKTPLDLALYYGHTRLAYDLLANGASDEQLLTTLQKPNPLTEPVPHGEAVVWFLGHASWAVKTQNNLLIFDYAPNPRISAPADSCLASGYILPEELKDQKVTVFSTHSHWDHYNKEIFTWKEQIPDIEYILCFHPNDTEEPYTYLPIHADTSLREMRIATIRSTDLDGAYLVEVDGVTLFHAGDHANGEDELMQAFTDEVDLIASKGLPVDILFGGIRGCSLGEPDQVKLGVEYMVKKLKPGVFIPMHCGEMAVEYQKFIDDFDWKDAPTKAKACFARGDHFTYKKEKLAAR